MRYAEERLFTKKSIKNMQFGLFMRCCRCVYGKIIAELEKIKLILIIQFAYRRS